MARQMRHYLVWAACAGLVLMIAGPAHAIECSQGRQRVQGDYIFSPYCEDVYLVQVAREYGIKASLSQVRENPNYKKDICRTVFTDIRVQMTCEAAGVPERRN